RKGAILPWLEQASRTDALNINLKMLLAQQYAAAGSLPQAEGVYEALIDDSPSEELYRAYFKLFREHKADAGQRMLERFNAALVLASRKPPEAGTPKAGSQARAMLAVLRDDRDLGRTLIDAAYSPRQSVGDLDYQTRFFLAMLADKHGRLEQ